MASNASSGARSTGVRIQVIPVVTGSVSVLAGAA
jgi:hypothetical protein